MEELDADEGRMLDALCHAKPSSTNTNTHKGTDKVEPFFGDSPWVLQLVLASMRNPACEFRERALTKVGRALASWLLHRLAAAQFRKGEPSVCRHRHSTECVPVTGCPRRSSRRTLDEGQSWSACGSVFVSTTTQFEQQRAIFALAPFCFRRHLEFRAGLELDCSLTQTSCASSPQRNPQL